MLEQLRVFLQTRISMPKVVFFVSVSIAVLITSYGFISGTFAQSGPTCAICNDVVSQVECSFLEEGLGDPNPSYKYIAGKIYFDCPNIYNKCNPTN